MYALPVCLDESVCVCAGKLARTIKVIPRAEKLLRRKLLQPLQRLCSKFHQALVVVGLVEVVLQAGVGSLQAARVTPRLRVHNAVR